MKILIVGGSGLIGGHAALLLTQQGHDVTIMSRKRPTTPALAALPYQAGDYVNDSFNEGQLEGFEAIVFSAAADIRNVPWDGSVTPVEFYTQHNDVAIPRFLNVARDAGVKRVVYIGTFYPQVAPEKIGECPYVTSRHNTDMAIRALSNESFTVCSLNAPFILGKIPGLEIPYIETLVQYAKGNIPDIPIFAPIGGTNHMSAHSLAQAVAGALVNGEGGKAYLVGDQNYSWKDYLETWFRLVGNPREIPVRDEDHPLFPNAIMFAGVGATVRYDIDDDTMAILNYDRQQMEKTIQAIIC